MVPATRLLLASALVFQIVSVSTQAQAAPEDWIVTSDTLVQQDDRVVTGSLIVTDGATLTVRGSTITIGRLVRVDPDSKLDLGPAGASPTIMAPVDPTRPIHLIINGTLATAGTPRTIIRGLGGHYLQSVFDGDGGINVNGTATLRDVWIHNGTAGVIVQEQGDVRVQDSLIEDVGGIPIAALGKASVLNSTLRGRLYGVSGRSSCDIRVADSVLESTGSGFHLNNCDGSVERSTLRFGGVAISINGASSAWINHTRVDTYRQDGLAAASTPEGVAKGHRPRIELRDVVFAPNATARRGVSVVGGDYIRLFNVTITGHRSVGVDAQSTDLEMRGCRVHNNQGYGVFALAGQLTGDPARDNDLGSNATGTGNRLGQISRVESYAAQGLKDQVAVPGLSLKVFGTRSTEAVFAKYEKGNPVMAVEYEAYERDADGVATYRGPFRYEAAHDWTPERFSGDVPTNSTQIDILLPANAKQPGKDWTGWITLAMLGAGFLLVAYGFMSKGRRRHRRRRK